MGMFEQLWMSLKKLSPRVTLEVFAAMILCFLCPQCLKLASESWSLSSFPTMPSLLLATEMSMNSPVCSTSSYQSSKSDPSFKVFPLALFLDLDRSCPTLCWRRTTLVLRSLIVTFDHQSWYFFVMNLLRWSERLGKVAIDLVFLDRRVVQKNKAS